MEHSFVRSSVVEANNNYSRLRATTALIVPGTPKDRSQLRRATRSRAMRRLVTGGRRAGSILPLFARSCTPVRQVSLNGDKLFALAERSVRRRAKRSALHADS